MSEAAPPRQVTGRVSIARLHGKACFCCGAVTRELAPAGAVVLPGRKRAWPIVTCGCCDRPLICDSRTAPHETPATAHTAPGHGQR